MSAEPDYLPADALAEEEPKYLRRQKPVEIRKRKFSRKTWPLYRRVLVGGVVVLGTCVMIYKAGQYFLTSPDVMIESDEQIVVLGNRFEPRAAIADKFAMDMGRSIVRVPLAERQKMLESLPWIEHASVQRVLPNKVRVEITERTPVAFLRTSKDLALVDVHGIVLERPAEGEFRFPVVNGINESMSAEDREQRMGMFVQFMKETEMAHPGANDRISEVDLSDATDVRATLTGLGSSDASSPILVHFGDSDFSNRYHLLSENIDQWRGSAGRVDSVDLRFARQVVVNPDDKKIVANSAPPAVPQRTTVARKRR